MTMDFNKRTYATCIISKLDSDRIDTHPLRRGRSRQDFVSELLLHALNQPEFVRAEEAAKGRIPSGYHEGEVEAVACPDPERENFYVSVRLTIGPLAGRRLTVPLWYPPADSPRQGPHQHFNVAVGLPPEARLFGRELEVEGRRVLVKLWYEHTQEGTVVRVHFFKATAENAA